MPCLLLVAVVGILRGASAVMSNDDARDTIKNHLNTSTVKKGMLFSLLPACQCTQTFDAL